MKHETVTLGAGMQYYYVKTDDEIESERRRDAARGHTLTSDGETILYSSVGRGTINVPIVATIIKKRGISWPHWSKKPSRLCEALVTINDVPRIVMFSYNSLTK